MLVLSRKKNEVIKIGDNITITVMDVRNNGSVRIGIEAPRDLAAHRLEVHEAIQKELERGKAGLAPITEDYDTTE